LFQQHTRYYLASASADEVWNHYKSTDFSVGWRGPIGRFGALYDPYFDVLYTPGKRPVPGIRTGQIVFLDLLIEAFLHITAAFQISDIDDELHIIEIYLSGTEYLSGPPGDPDISCPIRWEIHNPCPASHMVQKRIKYPGSILLRPISYSNDRRVPLSNRDDERYGSHRRHRKKDEKKGADPSGPAPLIFDVLSA
jgi:hypothetical protein